MLYIAYHLVYFLSYLMQCLCTHTIMKAKYSNRIVLTMLCTYSLLGSLEKEIPMHDSGAQSVCMLGTIILYIVMVVILYEDTLWKKLTAVIMQWVIAFLGDYVLIIIVYAFSPELLNRMAEVNAVSVLFGLLGDMVMVIDCILTVIMWTIIMEHKLIKGFFPTLLLPASQSLFVINEYGRMYGQWEHVSIFLIIGASMGLVCDMYWFYEVIYRSRQAEAEVELKELKYAMEVEKAHYHQIEENRELIAHIRHDLKNQIQSAKHLAAEGHQGQAMELLDSITDALNQTNEYLYSTIPIVNAVMNEKKKECLENKIVLESDLHMPENIPFEDVVLCSLFSNLLDNAIRAAAAEKEGARWIRVSSIYEGSFLIIKVRNASKPPEKLREGHGNGTKILELIAEMHNGSYKKEYHEGEYTAIVTLECDCGKIYSKRNPGGNA